jgi:hypothetical protein
MTFDDVVALASELPGIETGTSYGTPALRVRRKFMARLREDGDTLVLTPFDDIEQGALIATQPDVFYTTPHYQGHPTVLIRLSRIDPGDLRELVEQCWRRLAGKRLLQAYESRRV